MATYDIPPGGIQNMDEWLRIRLGRLTASRVADAFRRTQKGWSKDRENYRMELIAERLTGMAKHVYVSEAMTDGQLHEGDARRLYEQRYGVVVETPWFVPHPTIKDAGCSPDGAVGTEGMVQIKSPLAHTHLATLLNKTIDDDYLKQMQWEMACCQRQWSDYLSFNPTFPAPLRLYVERVYRDDKLIAEMESMAREFLDGIAATIKALGDFEMPKIEEPTREPAAEMGWSENVPASDFSSIETLIASGALKRGL